MSFFSEVNEDATTVTPEQIASGPLVGFRESWQTSFDAQMRASSTMGIEYFMHDLDWKQTEAMRAAGIEDAPQFIREANAPLDDGNVEYPQKDNGYYETFYPGQGGAYKDLALKYNGQPGSPEFEAKVQAYDKRIAELRTTHPDLKLMTTEEMFGKVKQDAQRAEERDFNDRRTWGGAVGSFFGSAFASMHPKTDLFNFATLGVGGAGKTVATRIAAQVGAQTVVETLNQVTGVQEQRALLGLSHGFADGASRVAGAAIGAGAIQGVGEVVGMAARRWFRDTPGDPAPAIPGSDPAQGLKPQRGEKVTLTPPEKMTPELMKEEALVARMEVDARTYLDDFADRTPLSGIRGGVQRVALDLGDMTRQLEAWDAPATASLGPRTKSVTFPGETPRATVDTSKAVESAALHQKARDLDPATFNTYDKLVERRDVYRRWIEELSQTANKETTSVLSNIETRIQTLEARLKTTQGKTNKVRIKQEIAEAVADRNKVLKASENKETPDIVQVRKDLIKNDEKMRDIAPMVGRAYSRARGSWGETPDELDAVWSAYTAGRKQPDMPVDTGPKVDEMMTLVDRAPVLRDANRVEPGATSSDTARAVIAENKKAIDASVEAYRAEVKSLVSSASDGKITVQGRDYEFDLDGDKMYIPHEDGTGGREVTMREFLEETKRADEELEAVSTCSIR